MSSSVDDDTIFMSRGRNDWFPCDCTTPVHVLFCEEENEDYLLCPNCNITVAWDDFIGEIKTKPKLTLL